MSEATTTEQGVAPLPDTPEYEAAMVAKVDEAEAKANEAAQGAPLEEAKVEEPAKEEKAPEEPPKEAKKEPEDAPEGTEAEKAVEAAGLDYDALQTEWENGGLSEDSYKALEKVGFSKDIVDQHIAGMEALAAITTMQAEEAAGGKEQLSAMQGWAVGSLSKAEIEAYNTAVTGSREEMLQAVRGLRNRFESEYGREPGLLGGSPAVQAGIGYASRAEMTADMRNPLYSKDPAYRAKVTAKVAATTAF